MLLNLKCSMQSKSILCTLPWLGKRWLFLLHKQPHAKHVLFLSLSDSPGVRRQDEEGHRSYSSDSCAGLLPELRGNK